MTGVYAVDVEGVPVDTRHWIGGRRVASAGTFDDISPIDETVIAKVGSSRVDLQACKLEYSIVSPK